MKSKYRNKGITLISLMITIIILLILVTVSVNLVMHNGILNVATQAEDQYILNEEKEKIKLGLLDFKMQKLKDPTEAKLRIDGTSSIEGNEVEGWTVVFEETGNIYDVQSDETINKIEPEKPVIGYSNEWEYTEADQSIKYIGTWSEEKGDTFIIPNFWAETENSTELKPVLKLTALNNSVKNTTNLKLQISNGIESIGTAFKGYSNFVGDLVIPNSIKIIENSAFSGCAGFTGDLIIGDGTETLSRSSFQDCGFTGKLVIGKNVQSTDSYTFYGTSGFTGELIVKSSTTVPSLPSYGLSDAEFSGLKIEGRPTTISTGAFNGLKGIQGDLIIPDSVVEIGGQAFKNCAGLTGNLEIPNSVQSIGNEAFVGCAGLTGDLIIGDGVETLSRSSFQNCGFTGKLVIGKSVQSTDSYAFYGTSGFTGELIVKSSTTVPSLPSYGLSDAEFSGLKIEGRPTTISTGAFNGLKGIQGDLIIPDSVVEIGGQAFKNCAGLTGNLEIPNSVQSIGNEAFAGCAGLTGDLIISDGIETLSRYSFQNCGFTGKLVIGKSVQTIDSYAFYGTSGFTGDIVIRAENLPSLPSYGISATYFNNVIIEDTVNTIATNGLKNIKNATGIVKINKSKDSISGSPWGLPATMTVEWLS